MTAKPEDDRKPENRKAEQRSAREQRLARSLRANLQKRKDQARGRRTKDGPGPE